MAHIPVLLHEVIDGLDIREGDIVLDCTVGSGGHSLEICNRIDGISRNGMFIGIDQDIDALERTKNNLLGCKCKISLINGNFRNLDKILEDIGIEKIDKALFDLGLSSNQLEESRRGFSFLRNEPLVMTFNAHPKDGDITAYEIVNVWREESIADIIFWYGEERYARKIAKGIVETRNIKNIETTADLVEIIKNNVPKSYSHPGNKTHFATKTFQALRITVNDEITSARKGITKALDRLNKNGRVAVITFHSIEDRMVKLLFKEKQKDGDFHILTKKPISPSVEEIKYNQRARSAKLRICQKL